MVDLWHFDSYINKSSGQESFPKQRTRSLFFLWQEWKLYPLSYNTSLEESLDTRLTPMRWRYATFDILTAGLSFSRPSAVLLQRLKFFSTRAKEDTSCCSLSANVLSVCNKFSRGTRSLMNVAESGPCPYIWRSSWSSGTVIRFPPEWPLSRRACASLVLLTSAHWFVVDRFSSANFILRTFSASKCLPPCFIYLFILRSIFRRVFSSGLRQDFFFWSILSGQTLLWVKLTAKRFRFPRILYEHRSHGCSRRGLRLN